MACANPACSGVGELLLPHPHPSGIGTNWEAPEDRCVIWGGRAKGASYQKGLSCRSGRRRQVLEFGGVEPRVCLIKVIG